MDSTFLIVLTSMLAVMGLFGAVFAFTGSSGTSKKRIASATRGSAGLGAATRNGIDNSLQRRKAVTALLKDLEKQQAEQKKRPTLRRRIEQAGLHISPRTFWIASAIAGLVTAGACMLLGQSMLVAALASFAIGLGLPRWTLRFLKNRRIKKFTSEFANALDVIVRSVKSGLPTTEALKIVAKEIAEPVASEFSKLVEGMKVGVTLEQGLKRMYESMPTAEVSFFGIVMTIQQKSGGNLSEALSNLSGILRDRKRLQGKIKAMSAEAKASAMIIGALPPGVMGLVYMASPDYIKTLFIERIGNLMLMGCVLWMSCGVFVMKKMISFKH
ncbi:MAG: type II secretion system F family protein [Rhizomicrobium sp.]|jgi:tight adherence protein B